LIKKAGRTHNQASRHPGISGTPGTVYQTSIGERETLRTPNLTIGLIRNVGEVGRRGGSQYKVTRTSYNPPEVN
jgi:hypothetical protein